MKQRHRVQACHVLLHMHQRRQLGRMLSAWRRDAREMGQTRAFFEQQKEREAEGGGWTWPEGHDYVSRIDRTVQLKVYSCSTPREPLPPPSLSPSPLSLPPLPPSSPTSPSCPTLPPHSPSSPPPFRYSVMLISEVWFTAVMCVGHGRPSLETLSSGTKWTSLPLQESTSHGKHM